MVKVVGEIITMAGPGSRCCCGSEERVIREGAEIDGVLPTGCAKCGQRGGAWYHPIGYWAAKAYKDGFRRIDGRDPFGKM